MTTPPIAPAAVEDQAALDAEVQAFLHDNVLFRGPDPEIMRDHRPAPRTALEEQAIAAGTDELTRTIIRNRLQTSANEAKEMLMHIASAPSAKWGDLISGIFTASGDLAIASSSGVLIFSVLAGPPIKYILKNWRDEETVGIRDGDVFMHNDARFGNVHNTDQSCLMPVFHEGELIAWVGTIIHEGENGATEPGGMPSAAESPYDEGLKISPLKIGENFRLREDLVTYFQNSVRDPKLQLEDMRSRLAGTMRLRERLLEAIEEYGRDAVVAVVRGTLEYTGAEVRRRLKALPDGKRRVVRFCDNTLREPILLKINCTIEIRGDEMIIDLRGSGPELLNRSINTVLASLKGMIAQVFLTFVWPDLPRNQAAFEPVTVLTDPGSAFDCSAEVPNAVSMMTFFPSFSAVEHCLQKFLHNDAHSGGEAKATEVHASWWPMINGFLFGGYTQHGLFVGNVMTDINGMGGGARHDRDGEHALAPIFCSMSDLGENEMVEDELPVLCMANRRIMRDNQGFGRHRGGHGHQQVMTFRNSPMWGWMAIAIGSKFPLALGLFGGYGSPCQPLMKVRGVNTLTAMADDPELRVDDAVELMNERPFAGADYSTSHTGLQFELAGEGDVYAMCQGGGGGYGDVLERDPEAVVTDLRRGLISAWTAQGIYRVAVDEHGDHDPAETERLRAEERAARLRRGVPFAEFERRWTSDLPPAGLPYYGSWADREVIHAGSTEVTMPADQLQSVMMP
ncbi:hydantoinase B/oxoprolinase family protein [Patulibacter defluvii]|uniref:hydantoinase B/oxoprolinase family protein n=1 Tax=Patulibacter defluvii TaxID=3095358 RepID=UPI002A75FD4B|nr:hydantoinase B/oxoprolinase family protein [Patulibacter sp. DM4]